MVVKGGTRKERPGYRTVRRQRLRRSPPGETAGQMGCDVASSSMQLYSGRDRAAQTVLRSPE